MAITRHGLEHFYLQGDEQSVPRKALVEAIELIDQLSQQRDLFGEQVYRTMEKIHPMQELTQSKLMMVTENGHGIHLTGCYLLIKDEPVFVYEKGDFFYRGMGYFSSYSSVFYPTDSLREPTQEEVEKWK